MNGAGDPAQVDEREEAKQATHTRGPLARGGAGLANARRDEGGGALGGRGGSWAWAMMKSEPPGRCARGACTGPPGPGLQGCCFSSHQGQLEVSCF